MDRLITLSPSLISFFLALGLGIPSIAPAQARNQKSKQIPQLPITIGNLASKELVRFGQALGVPVDTLNNSRFISHSSWVESQAEDYTYRIDSAGTETIRLRNFGPAAIKLVDTATPLINLRVRPSKAVLKDLEDKTREIAASLFPSSKALLNSILMKKEVLLIRSGGAGEKRLDFRYLVRLSSTKYGGPDFLQVLFDPAFKAVRIDTNLKSPTSETLREKVMKSSLTADPEPGALSTLGHIRFGNFYAVGEHRFEVTARSFIGEDFLTLKEERNPFGSDHFDISHTERVDVSAYRQSKDYHFWSYKWWETYGRVGAALGNFNELTASWQNANVEPYFQALGDYTFAAGEPVKTNRHRLSDGSEFDVPFATGEVMEQRFSRDLESCTIAAMQTHGGAINNALNFGRGSHMDAFTDTWFRLGASDEEMGSGSLRHLLLCGCSSMTLFRDKDTYSPLIREFLAGTYARGIRTVCGFDGEAVGLDRGGWEFFGQYNQGDSIADSWAISNIGECPANSPVTVAYGADTNEALSTLLDGRFLTSRASPASSCASVWVNLVGDNAVRDDLFAFPNEEGIILSHSQGFGELQVDKDVGGSPLKVGSRTYSTGLGTHAKSRIVIQLPPGTRRISGKVGVVPNDSGKGSIVAGVYVNGRMLFESSVLRSGMDAVPFSVDVTGSSTMELLVGDAGDGIE